jgi:dienelactone hydrolase
MKHVLSAIAVASLASCASVSASAPTERDAPSRRETLRWDADGVTFEGVLVHPSQKEIRGAVLVFPDYFGVTEYPRVEAERLARLGFEALVVDLYGGGLAARDDADASARSGALIAAPEQLRVRAQAALAALQARVPGKPVAAVGFSFGGHAALELARLGAELSSVAVVWGVLETPQAAGAEGIRAPVLVLHGTRDPIAPLDSLVRFTQEMDAAGRPYRVVLFGGARHAFTNPAVGAAPEGPLAFDAASADAAHRELEAFLLGR